MKTTGFDATKDGVYLCGEALRGFYLNFFLPFFFLAANI
jgi:hypothetical protein